MAALGVICAVCAFILGFVFGCICDCEDNNMHCECKNNTLKIVDEEDKEKAERAEREYRNFLAYDGTEQEDVNI